MIKKRYSNRRHLRCSNRRNLRWTKPEKNIIKKYYKTATWDKLFEKLPNRTKNAIKQQAKTLKIKRYDSQIFITISEMLCISKSKLKELRKKYNLNKIELEEKLELAYNKWWIKDIMTNMMENNIDIFGLFK